MQERTSVHGVSNKPVHPLRLWPLGPLFSSLKRCFILAAAVCLLGVEAAWADVRVSSLFSDGAVLQRDIAAPVWGLADAGETVVVSMNGKEAHATADASGRWSLQLPAQPAGGPFDMTIAGKNTLVIRDIAVGEVWLASGQSNMAFAMDRIQKSKIHGGQADDDVRASADPMIRLFNVTRKPAPDGPVDNVTTALGEWKEASPENTPAFSAVAYYYAKELRQRLNVPVGIILSARGGTPAEAWTSRSALDSNPVLKPFTDRWEKLLAEYPAKQKEYDEVTLPQWQAAADKARAEGAAVPPKPQAPTGPMDFSRPSTLFNSMISPVVPYGMRGVIWYQGESNGPKNYRELFATLITDWRARWKQGDFPFLYVQLANYKTVQTQPSEGGWAGVREAQMLTLTLPNTGMASAIDLADPENPNDIHPHNKKDVGRRLSLIALATVYKEKVSSYSGPIYSGVTFKGKEARLTFTHVDGGLVARGEGLKGFAIAGKDRNFVWADARIEGDEVIVSSEQVPEPAAVRYGWAMNPIGNLYNKEGLPASSFRTDVDAAE